MWHPVDLKRSKLSRVADWHIALGKYAARMQAEAGGIAPGFFGRVPNYIWDRTVKSFFGMILNVFSWLKFFKEYRTFYTCIGMVQEFQSSSLPREHKK